ncbi:MAG: hypothetical protein HYR96_03770 [Deltaproteobacteria bacterium]|nr:hypothetical protein [Deltaproteobacteria bacterium]MBI3295306.1 hypothetical protein [Deltaproteobacteria bacterium]
MKSTKQKNLVLLVVGVTFLCAAQKKAESENILAGREIGLGIILGSPSGLVGKMKISNNAAIDAGVTFFFGTVFLVYGDYLVHFPNVLAGQSQFSKELTPYVGLGAEAIFGSYWGSWALPYAYNSTLGLGVRVPIGIEWRPHNPPIGMFVELAPGIGLLPGIYSYFRGGIGARYYF